MNHAVVEVAHAGEMLVQFAFQRTGARLDGRAERHLAGEQIQLIFILRKSVRLAVLVELQTVFQMTQKLVGRREFGILQRRQQFFIPQARKSQLRAAVTDPAIAPAVPPRPLQAPAREIRCRGCHRAPV